jgi:uncharacterized heparinase superfamily protein
MPLSFGVARSAMQAMLARLYSSRLYRWRYARREPERLVLAPQDLRAADPTRAAEIIDGRFTFAGKIVDAHGVSPFALIAPVRAWTDALLGFTWLRHLRAADTVAGRNAARQLVGDFVRSMVRFSPEALEPLTTARRVLAWLTQAPLALDGADRGFYRAFVRSLAWQANYLLHAGPVGRDGMPRLLCAIAAAQASLCLSDNAGLRRRATRGLVRELERQVLPDGCHIARNPQAIVELLLDLLPLRQSYQARNVAPPQEVISAVDRLMPMLRFFRHADGAFATFNGMGYTQAHLIATLLTYDDARGKPVQNAPHGGYQRVDAGGSVVLVDTGRPPPLTLSHEAHAGTLSFEFSAEGARIIVNCGAPTSGRDSWRQLARETSAHSTLCVGKISSCVFSSGRGREGLPDRPIVRGPEKVEVERREAGGATTLLTRHDGYRRACNLVHERELVLVAATGALEGRDSIAPASGSTFRGKQEVVVRFHLHPAVAAEPGGREGEILLLLPGGTAWRFRSPDVAPVIEESVHFANPEGPRRTSQIVLPLRRGGADAITTVRWALERDT